MRLAGRCVGLVVQKWRQLAWPVCVFGSHHTPLLVLCNRHPGAGVLSSPWSGMCSQDVCVQRTVMHCRVGVVQPLWPTTAVNVCSMCRTRGGLWARSSVPLWVKKGKRLAGRCKPHVWAWQTQATRMGVTVGSCAVRELWFFLTGQQPLQGLHSNWVRNRTMQSAPSTQRCTCNENVFWFLAPTVTQLRFQRVVLLRVPMSRHGHRVGQFCR